MPRLPITDKTAWVNPGNRPERVTAQPKNLPKSVKGSIGGKGMHMDPPGIHVVMEAPRQYEAQPVQPMAPVKPKPIFCMWCSKQFATKSQKERHRCAWKRGNRPKESACPHCGEVFPSKTQRGRHQAQCRGKVDACA